MNGQWDCWSVKIDGKSHSLDPDVGILLSDLEYKIDYLCRVIEQMKGSQGVSGVN